MNAKFICECKNLGIIDLSSEAQFQKAVLVGKKYGIAENDIKKTVEEYFIEEKRKEDVANEKADREAKEKAKKIKEEKYEREVKEQKRMVDSPYFVGREKRIYGLKKILSEINESLSEIKSEISDLNELANAVRNSANIEKTNDWATYGGLAAGLAGPGAGVVIAAQTIAENEEIEARNAQNTRYAHDLSEEIRKTAQYRTNGLNECMHDKKVVEEEIEKASLALVDEGESSKIFEMLDIEIISVQEKRVNINIKSKESIKIFEEVDAVVDGTFWVHVYQQKEYVGSTRVELPLEGVDDTFSEIEQFTALGIDPNIKIDVELEPEKLWLIEKMNIDIDLGNWI